MSANSQRALVPVKKLSPPAVIEKNRDLAPLDLVNGNLSLHSREEVKKLLQKIIYSKFQSHSNQNKKNLI